MPTWRVHVFTGVILTTLMIYGCYYFDYWELFIYKNQIQYFFWLHVWFIAILGSVLPDFDSSKTRIRHAFGMLMGAFIVVSLIYLHRFEPLNIKPISLIFIVLLFIIIPFLIGLVVPFKHHGKFHSVTAAAVYALVWLLLEFLAFDMTSPQAGMIGAFAFVGYMSHLLMDRDLKLI